MFEEKSFVAVWTIFFFMCPPTQLKSKGTHLWFSLFGVPGPLELGDEIECKRHRLILLCTCLCDGFSKNHETKTLQLLNNQAPIYCFDLSQKIYFVQELLPPWQILGGFIDWRNCRECWTKWCLPQMQKCLTSDVRWTSCIYNVMQSQRDFRWFHAWCTW